VRIDRIPPVISGMPSRNCVLWPPNAKWLPVASLSATDALSGVAPDSLQLNVDSSEPFEAKDGDVMIIPNENGAVDVWLRAKRPGNGSLRLYSLTAAAADLAGNVTTADRGVRRAARPARVNPGSRSLYSR
jgi:hypothetical protein